MVQAIHALALAEGKTLRRHSEVKRYLKSVAQMQSDEEMWRLFQTAEAFHANFYQDFMEEEEIKENFAAIERLLSKIQRLMPV